MLKDTIKAYEEHRITDAQYLDKVKEVMDSVLSHTDDEIPLVLKDKDIAKAYYGVTKEMLVEKIQDEGLLKIISSEIAIASEDIIQKLIRVDWYSPNNIDIQRRMIHLIGDYLIDEVRDKYQIAITFEDIDKISERIVDIAKVRRLS